MASVEERAWLRWEKQRFEGVGVVEIPRPERERLAALVDMLHQALKELRDVAEEIQYGHLVEEERFARAVLNATSAINEVEGRG